MIAIGWRFFSFFNTKIYCLSLCFFLVTFLIWAKTRQIYRSKFVDCFFNVHCAFIQLICFFLSCFIVVLPFGLKIICYHYKSSGCSQFYLHFICTFRSNTDFTLFCYFFLPSKNSILFLIYFALIFSSLLPFFSLPILSLPDAYFNKSSFISTWISTMSQFLLWNCDCLSSNRKYCKHRTATTTKIWTTKILLYILQWFIAKFFDCLDSAIFWFERASHKSTAIYCLNIFSVFFDELTTNHSFS